MADKKFTLLGQIKAKKGSEQALKEELQSLIDKSRGEAGNIHYNLFQSLDDDSLFLFHETWRDQEAFDGHMSSPYLKSFLAKESELLAEPPKGNKIKILE